MIGIDSRSYENVVCEVVKLAAEQRLGLRELHCLRANMEVASFIDHQARAMVIHLESCALGRKVERVDIEEKWPADWWQAFRERWAPSWWLKRHPVKHKKVSVHKEVWRVCPHIGVKANGRHVEFMLNKEPSMGAA